MSELDEPFWQIVRANWTPAERWNLALSFARAAYALGLA